MKASRYSGGGAGGSSGGGAGGTGFGQYGGAGGAGGTAQSPNGKDGGNGRLGDDYSDGDGGGGGGGFNGNGAGSVLGTVAGSLTGGAGGNGGFGATYSVRAPAVGGSGGFGGYGAIATDASGATVRNSFDIIGGNGGAGRYAGGSGGGGGIGIYFRNSGVNLINDASGKISGGNGGYGARFGSAGAGGAGVVGQNLSIINAGTIAGGLAGNGRPRADAITLTGGSDNILAIGASARFGGGITLTTADTTLTFDQSIGRGLSADAALTSAIKGAGSIVKVGEGKLTLSGAGSFSGGTLVVDGILSLQSLTGAGTGTITLEAGTSLELASNGSLANDIDFDSSTGMVGAAAGISGTVSGDLDVSRTSELVFGSALDTGTIVYVASTSASSALFKVTVAGGTLAEGGTLGALLADNDILTTIDAGATLDLGTSNDTIDELAGRGTLTNRSGGTTTIEGGVFAGTIAGSGEVDISFSVELSGVSTNSGKTVVDAGAVLALAHGGSTSAASQIVDGGLIRMVGGTLAGTSLAPRSKPGKVNGYGVVSANVVGRNLSFNAARAGLTFTGDNSFAGGLSGTRLSLAAGTDQILTTADISSTAFDIRGASVTIASSRSYSGAFTLAAGTLNLGLSTLSLLGTATFSGGAISGSGVVSLNGDSAITGRLSLLGQTALTDSGSLDATGSLLLKTKATLTIDSEGIYALRADVGILGAKSQNTITNDGVLVKMAGSGTSRVTAGVTNNGEIDVKSGTLALQNRIDGAGELSIFGNATLEIGDMIATSQTAQFEKGDGTLKIDDASDFHAKLSGFDAGDRISLQGFDDMARVMYDATVRNAGVLTVKEGSQVFSTTIEGHYNAGGFSLTNGPGNTAVLHYGAAKA